VIVADGSEAWRFATSIKHNMNDKIFVTILLLFQDVAVALPTVRCQTRGAVLFENN
jgi:hypothetical protein